AIGVFWRSVLRLVALTMISLKAPVCRGPVPAWSAAESAASAAASSASAACATVAIWASASAASAVVAIRVAERFLRHCPCVAGAHGGDSDQPPLAAGDPPVRSRTRNARLQNGDGLKTPRRQVEDSFVTTPQGAPSAGSAEWPGEQAAPAVGEGHLCQG